MEQIMQYLVGLGIHPDLAMASAIRLMGPRIKMEAQQYQRPAGPMPNGHAEKARNPSQQGYQPSGPSYTRAPPYNQAGVAMPYGAPYGADAQPPQRNSHYGPPAGRVRGSVPAPLSPQQYARPNDMPYQPGPAFPPAESPSAMMLNNFSGGGELSDSGGE